ncbi:MAG TPA: hypothetical protein VGJ33_09575 [Candidatus Angelobacter sp.]
MARVLLVGYVAEFLQSSDRVLRAAGHQVTTAPSFITAITTIELGSFDVAILGFSVPAPERSELARRLKQASPGAKIIMLYFSDIEHTELADALLPTTSSAEDVLRTVNHLLAGHRPSQTG